LIYRKQLGESITSVGVGFVTNMERKDIIVGTFSGKIIALREVVGTAVVQEGIFSPFFLRIFQVCTNQSGY
jgi:hypothetical protein